MPDRLLACLAVILLVPLAGGCNFFESSCDEKLDPSCLGRDLHGRGVGEECDRTVQCDAFLECVDGACEVTGETGMGGDCRRTGECAEGLYCSHRRTCDPAGDGVLGDDCESTADCEAGLLCGLGAIPLKLECVEAGALDKGAECVSTTQCTAGLTCFSLEGPATCRSNLPPLEQEVPPVPVWIPDACPDDVDEATAYFEVPRGGEPLEDFYRLPFPNDIRRKDGKIDLSGHPRPPAEAGLPIVERFIDGADGSLSGFSTNPVVYFRFSEDYDFDNAVLAQALQIVDISPDAEDRDNGGRIQWYSKSSNYICDNWLAVRRAVGNPLRPGATYAALITTQVKTADGKDFARSSDLQAMLADSAPGDADLRDAWTAYAPLRAWLTETDTAPGTILNAAVFTTQNPVELVAQMREAIQAADLPSVSDLTKCEDGVTSPCETMQDGEVRGACVNSGRGYTELHGRISLANFQVGELPFLMPEDVGGQTSGDIKMSGSGKPQVDGRNDVCFSLAIPDGDAPADGWPLLIYAHGTGGSFTGHLGRNGWAEEVAGGSSPAATLAIDMPQHGERRGDSTEDPELLFFNVINPHAARGNVLQGSADLMSLSRWAVEGSIGAGASPTGAAVSFDDTRIAVLGHSQGATHAAIMLPFEPNFAAGMLSGVGGHLTTSMLTKTEPLPIADAVGVLMMDLDGSDLACGDYNPGLALVQTFYDVADPINYAGLLATSPVPSAPTGHHVFMSYGLNDHYSPEETQEAYARAGDFPHVGPELRSLDLKTIAEPAFGNVSIGGVDRTFGMHQYAPKAAANGDAVDGHFVAVRSDQDGFPDVSRFLGQVFSGITPDIGN